MQYLKRYIAAYKAIYDETLERERKFLSNMHLPTCQETYTLFLNTVVLYAALIPPFARYLSRQFFGS